MIKQQLEVITDFQQINQALNHVGSVICREQQKQKVIKMISGRFIPTKILIDSLYDFQFPEIRLYAFQSELDGLEKLTGQLFPRNPRETNSKHCLLTT